ncbi:hypothetical protein [Nonomuraea sp. NPDC052265]|uniref:hypothetical protein n=1 Tax=Nonomuraea sp. NPDC052265 TaxID=3364374 RepID=UPI0037C7C31F
MREGLRFLTGGDRVVLTTALSALACNFGVVYAFQGAGAVIGAVLGSRLVARCRPGPTICWDGCSARPG